MIIVKPGGGNLYELVEENLRFFIAFYHLEKASQSVVKLRKIQRGRRVPADLNTAIKLLQIKADNHWRKFMSTLQ
ncbi:MAG: hypothetical protein N2246_02520 [Candidatus Sumerlaeia bacterium]|nr:hypothetical protein [Candidatus Sumerlaeia bacterium]